MHLQWYAYPLAIAAGILAGIINTLAGSGSLITLPMLIFLGLPANLANGTNRVGVAIQNVVGITAYRQGGRLDLSGTPWLLVPGILGAIAGARIAAQLNAKAMNTAIGVVMLVMLGVILFDPKRWLRERSIVKPGRPGIAYIILFFGLGIYAGFIQAGIGILLLATMVLGLGYSLVDANGLKLVIVLAFTLTALVVFVINGQVNWGMGALMAVGQSIGAWLAARFAVRNKNANVWVRRLLIAVVSVSIWKLFGLPPF